jgi:hypothetical protein
MGRVGLIDIMVATRAHLGAFRNVPPRDAARRTTSLRNASRWGHPGGSRAFSADGLEVADLITNTAANLKSSVMRMNQAARPDQESTTIGPKVAAHRP